jgi:hypothetical protein
VVIKNVILSLFLIVFGAGGVWLVATGAGEAREAWASSGWPSTPGTVLSAEVQTHTSVARHGSGTSYTPRISYSYAVNGEAFTGTTIAPGRMWATKSAYTAVRMFPAGSEPPVYYAPGDPKEAVLVPGLHVANLAKMFFGFVPLAFVAIFALSMFAPAPAKQFLWAPIALLVIGIGGIIYLSSL